jgi:hypothetical protein
LLDAEPVAAASKRKKWLELFKSMQMTMFAPHFPDTAPVQFQQRRRVGNNLERQPR